MLKPSFSVWSDEMPEFNREIIRKHGIRTIAGDFSTKAARDMIRDSKEATYYKFNKFGELTFEYKTFLGDTIYTIYVWDERSNLIIKRSADKYSFRSTHYRYDSRNRVVAIESRECLNTGQNKEIYVPEENYITRTEKFEYEDLEGNNYKKKYLNGSDLVYREEFFYFNEKNLLIEQTAYQKPASGKTSILYFYDEKNRITSKSTSILMGGQFSFKTDYFYDSSGNLLSMNYYANEELKTEYQFVYDEKNELLKAVILRDAKTDLLTIIKYDLYSFY